VLPPVPDPVPLELEPPPGLDFDPVAPPVPFAASPPVPDVLFLSSEQPGNVIPRNPAKMIAVHNEVPSLISSSSRSGLTVTLAILKATHMPSFDIKFFTRRLLELRGQTGGSGGIGGLGKGWGGGCGESGSGIGPGPGSGRWRT
jgi:uncharacterized membrane protein YgcG